MTTSLITGANRGLAFESARQLIAAGHQLAATEDASVAAAVEDVGALDVLVNNAGINGGRPRRPRACRLRGSAGPSRTRARTGADASSLLSPATAFRPAPMLAA